MDTTPDFNPFEDRFSRDLRNDLSEAFVRDLESGTEVALSTTIAHYRSQNLTSPYLEYLNDREGRYLSAMTTIADEKDPLKQAVILWNQQLFFEVHEVLEHAWYSAEGNYRETLQAIIRAAGVYIKRRYGYVEAAARIGAKALPVLKDNKELLEPYFDVDQLTSVLADDSAPPPILKIE